MAEVLGWLAKHRGTVGCVIKRWRDHLQRIVELPKCHEFIASWPMIIRALVVITLSIILDLNVYGNKPRSHERHNDR